MKSEIVAKTSLTNNPFSIVSSIRDETKEFFGFDTFVLTSKSSRQFIAPKTTVI